MRSGVPHVAIAGGGMVGASMALALRDWPGRVTLVDDWQPSSSGAAALDVRTTAIALGSRYILESIGAWAALQAHAHPILAIHVTDRGHFGATRLCADEEEVPALGYVVENHALHRALSARLDDCENLERVPGRVDAARPGDDAVEVRVGDRNLQAQLLLVAAGGGSPLAARLGFGHRERRYGQTAIVTNVRCSRPRPGWAHERFTRSGPLALLPLDDGCYAVVMSVYAEQADALCALPEQDFLARLQAAFGNRVGRFVACGARAAFELSLLQADQQVRDRMALIGNAARTLHPVAGQGFNLALRDAYQLADLLLHETRDPGDVQLLAGFARLRRHDQQATVRLTDGLVTLFSNRSPPLVLARGAGLVALDLVPALRRRFAATAMGTRARIRRPREPLRL